MPRKTHSVFPTMLCACAKASRLSNCSRSFLAGPTGFEPATSPVTGERSSQLSYGPKNNERTLKRIFLCGGTVAKKKRYDKKNHELSEYANDLLFDFDTFV